MKSSKDIIRDYISDIESELDKIIDDDDYNAVESERDNLLSEIDDITWERDCAIEENKILKDKIADLENEIEELKEKLNNKELNLW